MGCDLTIEAPVFFVCGTPRDLHGFDFKALDGRRLPAQFERDLDNLPKEKFPTRGCSAHVIRRIGTGNSEVTIYAEYRSINPNDTARNRGAYIAVGCCIEAPLTIVEAVEALDRIEAIHTDLAARRDPDTDAFRSDFHLRKYTAPESPDRHRGQWSDIICRATSETGRGELVLTSREVEQGALERYVTREEPPKTENPHPVAPVDRNWTNRLHVLMQEAGAEASETRRNLRDLERLEEKRAHIIKTLSGTAKRTPRRMPARKPGDVITDPKFMLPAAAVGATLAIAAAVIAVLV